MGEIGEFFVERVSGVWAIVNSGTMPELFSALFLPGFEALFGSADIFHSFLEWRRRYPSTRIWAISLRGLMLPLDGVT
ncbi:MAG: hypothetical protein KOO63_10765 [Bacteroidales bacterium]|nr:hypothetical protein [Candidatus Latescibacterota bacterium]